MIGGSIVHMGTLDDNSTRYIVLGVIEIALMISGSVFEACINKEIVGLKYFAIATALSIATGFLSDGIQHFLDNPVYAGYLLSIGLVVAYVTFARKYHLTTTTQGLATVIVIGLLILFASNTLLHDVVPHTTGGHHH